MLLRCSHRPLNHKLEENIMFPFRIISRILGQDLRQQRAGGRRAGRSRPSGSLRVEELEDRTLCATGIAVPVAAQVADPINAGRPLMATLRDTPSASLPGSAAPITAAPPPAAAPPPGNSGSAPGSRPDANA